MELRKDALTLRTEKKDKFRRTDLVLERAARKGFVEIYLVESTRWNYFEEGKDPETPKEDGTFDVEGHYSSDVFALWDLRWWKKRHRSAFKNNIVEYLKDIKEFIADNPIRLLIRDPKRLVGNINYLLLDNPFRVKREGWVWVVDSLSYSMKRASYDLAEDLFAKELGFENAISMFQKTNKVNDHKKVQAKAEEFMSSELGRKQVYSYMVKEGNLVKVTNHMWVCEDDPTCFVVDDNFMHFDMRDGWSPETIAQIISYWFRIFYGVDITVNIRQKS
jgi:hypothetical protein